MSKIYDNIDANNFENGLHSILKAGGVKRSDFCVGYFNLRGWKDVAEDVDALEGCAVLENHRKGGKDDWIEVPRVCRLLIGMHRPPSDLLSEMYGVVNEPLDQERVKRWKRMVSADFRRQLTLGIPTSSDETALKKLREQLMAGKVVVKLHLRFPLHAKLYLAYRPGDPTPVLSIMGSSNLTFAGLTRNGELNAEFADVADTDVYERWFNDRWNDLYSIDITSSLIEVLDESWASAKGYTPYEIYLKVMYNLSREARCGVSEYKLPAPFDEELFEFQQTAVKLAVRHLETRGGAMIGDVVGLGKTITACAVAKYYESVLGASTLVVCPANLVEMWREYAKKYDLKMEARSVAQRFDPRRERFFKLVIIDESQNLRNSEGQRYAQIKDLLNYQGNKVLLLTATPYNKDYSDLANQLRLFVDPDADIGIRPESYIKSLGGEYSFAAQYPDTQPTTLRAFEKSNSSDDWRDLMKLYLVRRTRTFIKKNYAKTDATNGRKYLEFKDGTRNYFPDRKPITMKFNTEPGDQFERLYSDQIMDLLSSLQLPRYGLQQYIDQESLSGAGKNERQILENLSRAGRRLMGFCRSGFFKRMDSSGIAFLMSLYRHAVRNAMYLYAIQEGVDIPLRVDTDIDCGLEEECDDGGEQKYEFSSNFHDYEVAGEALYKQVVRDAGPSVAWISPTYFTEEFAVDIKRDTEIILEMLGVCGAWLPDADEKLKMLHKLLVADHGTEKVLVFTQYADTARYIAKQLENMGVDHIAQVDGDSEDVVSQIKKFSPVSNHENDIPSEDQTRILIATDMLSEGQNLQDAHIVVNFDLPWAIIRLIQRAGRVDRIGQKSEVVYCYSFFPQEGVENLIRLRGRLNQRINENAGVIGSDEIFFEGNQQNLTDLFNEKSGILDEQDDGEVDLSSQAYQVWQTATKDNKALADRIMGLADGIYSAKSDVVLGRGVIAHVRAANDSDVLVWLDENGNVKSNSPLKIMQALACSELTPSVPPLDHHHELVRAVVETVKTSVSLGMGVLGSKSSVKYRIYAMLERRLNSGDSLPSFTRELKAITDELYNYPMFEMSRNMIGKMFYQKRSDDEILETVVNLHGQNRLCNVPESDDADARQARVVCSLGLV